MENEDRKGLFYLALYELIIAIVEHIVTSLFRVDPEEKWFAFWMLFWISVFAIPTLIITTRDLVPFVPHPLNWTKALKIQGCPTIPERVVVQAEEEQKNIEDVF